MLCIIRVCNQLFLKGMSKNQTVYCHLYAYDDTLLVLAFKLILVYFQHYSLYCETVSTYDHLLN